MRQSPRIFPLITLLCFTSLAFAYGLQYGFGQAPCDLCLLQRFCFYGVGIVALIATLHRPRAWGSRVYASLCLLFSMGGLAAAGRQVYLQSLPEDLKPSCGPGLLFRLNHSPWLDALAQAMQGTGDCAKIGWTLMGMSLAFWSGVLFLILVILSIKKVVHF